MKICIVIPNYNHNNIVRLLHKLESYNLPCIIVDDGSNVVTKQELANAAKQFSWVTLLTLEHNQGKGMALLAGFEYAVQQNYTHAIQIDADGQHDVNDIPKFLAAIEQNPCALITGKPIYDNSIPTSRLYGRKITNFWVKLETFSTAIKDAMCGYRAYPLQPTLSIMRKHFISKRMGFDIEIIVKLQWSGCAIISIPTKVIYPEKGVSHFKFLRDNLSITMLHTCLFWEGLVRLFCKSVKDHDKHWSEVKEKGSRLGMMLILYSYRIFGRRLAKLLLYPIVFNFYCCNPKVNKASRKYLAKVNCKASSFKHFLSFADSLLDKVAVWDNQVFQQQVALSGVEELRKQIACKQGGIIFTAHLGNMEIARMLSKFDSKIKINAIMFTANAKKITSFFEKINPQFRENIFLLENLDVHSFIILHEKVKAGEFLVITCDRTSTTHPERSVKAKFLDEMACFPEGPFVLASLLQCPVYFMLCLKEDNNLFKIIFRDFAESVYLGKTERRQQLQLYAQKYAQLLEEYCRQYPLQWFNFFDFWKIYENE